jgi:hypothetical protein
VKVIGGIVDLGTNEKSQGSDDLWLSFLHMYVSMWHEYAGFSCGTWFWGEPCPLDLANFISNTTFENKRHLISM